MDVFVLVMTEDETHVAVYHDLEAAQTAGQEWVDFWSDADDPALNITWTDGPLTSHPDTDSREKLNERFDGNLWLFIERCTVQEADDG